MNKVMWSLLAGVVIGVLVAPDKGSETIKRFRRRVKDLGDDAQGTADDLADKAGSAYDKAKNRMSEAVE